MQELTTLMETHVDHNSRLREENNKMASQMTILLAQYEEKEGGSNAKTQERILELKLYEAKLAKAQIEKAGKYSRGGTVLTNILQSHFTEMNADFTRERLEFHKLLIDAHAQRDSAQQQFYDLGETVKLYQEQYAELEKNMKDGGATKKEVGSCIIFGITSSFLPTQKCFARHRISKCSARKWISWERN